MLNCGVDRGRGCIEQCFGEKGSWNEFQQGGESICCGELMLFDESVLTPFLFQACVMWFREQSSKEAKSVK